MDFTPKDLGETPSAPDMSNFKNPLGQQPEGNIIIGNFTISPLMQSQKSESLAEVLKKESTDSSI
ncbi:hypothetical protein [Flavobacterium sp.]|uniref:hypothetical protein n=1 Tax=unclassified Flavobacterium TaxID=196869 RepID=UPI0025BC7B1C|nr:hypothetical protein [Flavobacterium sp.]